MATETTSQALREHVIKTIVDRVPNPFLWLLAVRRLAEQLRLDPAHCIELSGTLVVSVATLLFKAERHSRTADQVREALEAPMRIDGSGS